MFFNAVGLHVRLLDVFRGGSRISRVSGGYPGFHGLESTVKAVCRTRRGSIPELVLCLKHADRSSLGFLKTFLTLEIH